MLQALIVKAVRSFLGRGRQGWKSRLNHLLYLYAVLSHNSRERKLYYLDVGGGDGIIATAFGQGFASTWVIDAQTPDHRLAPELRDRLNYVIADARALPFRNGQFHLVTMFSLLEHVEGQQEAVSEALRVLLPGGELAIEIPNRYFPIDPHSGWPNHLLLPRFLKSRLSQVIGYIYTPAPGELRQYIVGSGYPGELKEVKVIWPAGTIPAPFKYPYLVLKRLGFFHLLLPTYFLLFRRADSGGKTPASRPSPASLRAKAC